MKIELVEIAGFKAALESLRLPFKFNKEREKYYSNKEKFKKLPMITTRKKVLWILNNN